eukprot:scaffold115305_cov35-Tisochrysis_lutea.AAC.1
MGASSLETPLEGETPVSPKSRVCIPELFITDDWAVPENPDRDTTARSTDDVEIRHQLRKYYKCINGYTKTVRQYGRPTLRKRSGRSPSRATTPRNSKGQSQWRNELQTAIRSIGSGKSARPDAIPAEFYANFEDVVKHDFLSMLNIALASGELHFTVREGDIILLYEKGDSRDPRNYRPITLSTTK